MILEHKAEFQKALGTYHISSSGQAALKDLKLVLLMAATSTGRNRLSKHLVKSGKYYYIVSDTTRAPQVRDGALEQNGVQYFFRTEEEVLADLQAGNFLEAELIHDQQVSGISIRELKKAKASGKIAFTEVDIAGVTNIKKVKPDALAIFLLPPSYDEWRKRIASRGGLGPGELERRLATAKRFLEQAPKHGYFNYVIAEYAPHTAKIIDDLVAGLPNPHQARGEQIIRELLSELNKIV